MYLRAFWTYKSVVMYSYISDHSELTSQWLCTHVSQSSQNLQVSSYVLMYLRAVRTYKSVVMYSCISEHSELTSQWLCTHASLSIQNLQVSSYVLVYLRAYITYKSVVMYSWISEHSELTRQWLRTHVYQSSHNLHRCYQHSHDSYLTRLMACHYYLTASNWSRYQSCDVDTKQIWTQLEKGIYIPDSPSLC